MNERVVVIVLVIQLLNLGIHLFGCYLLVIIYRSDKASVQMIYLFNLSITEIIINLIGILLTPVTLFGTPSFIALQRIFQVQYHIMIVLESGVLLIYYFAMIYITLDKLLEITLNIRYPIYWNSKKAKCLIIATWIFCILLGVFVSIYSYMKGVFLEAVFVKYVYPVLDIGYLTLACVTYVFIFRKFKRSQAAPIKLRRASVFHQPQLTNCQVFLNSNFRVPVLLITTFLFLVVIPDLIYLFVGIVMKKRSDGVVAYCFISILLSYFVDGFIYILLHSKVRAILTKKMRKWRRRFKCTC